MKTIHLKRYFYVISIFLVATTLTACKDDELTDEDLSYVSHLISNNLPPIDNDKLIEQLEENYDPSKIPLGMRNGIISKDYYLLLMDLANEIIDYVDENEYITNKSDSTIEEKIEERIKLNNDTLLFLNSVNHSPTNDVEQEIHEYTQKVVLRFKNLTNYRIKYYSGDELYHQMSLDEYDAFITDSTTWSTILDKYELFLEE